MAETKTKPTKVSVTKFIAGVENETRRKDAMTLLSKEKVARHRELASEDGETFLDWLAPASGLRWLDVGRGQIGTILPSLCNI